MWGGGGGGGGGKNKMTELLPQKVYSFIIVASPESVFIHH